MRIRTIKPEFWSNEFIAKLDDFTQLLAIGLLNYADDEGYFNANPALIKAALFPLRDVSGRIPVAVTNLSNQGFLKLYEGEDGRTYGHIVNFSRHQVINKRKDSKIKPLCKRETGLLHLYGSDTVSLPSGTGNREQGMEQGTLAPEPSAQSPVDGSTPPAPKKKPTPRNTLMDTLATVGGGKAEEIPASVWPGIGKCLAEIKAVTPDVTPEEILRRAANYRTHFQAAITSQALAKWWARCDQPATGNLFQTDEAAAQSKLDPKYRGVF